MGSRWIDSRESLIALPDCKRAYTHRASSAWFCESLRFGSGSSWSFLKDESRKFTPRWMDWPTCASVAGGIPRADATGAVVVGWESGGGAVAAEATAAVIDAARAQQKKRRERMCANWFFQLEPLGRCGMGHLARACFKTVASSAALWAAGRACRTRRSGSVCRCSRL